MRVLGIDPGTAHCGFAALELVEPHALRVRDLGCFKSDPDARLRDRVAELTGDLNELLVVQAPDVVVAEAPAFPKGALAAAMVWASFSVLVALCKAHRVELVTRNPAEWRKLLGLLEEKLPPAPKRTGRGDRYTCACGERLPEGWKNCTACRGRAKLSRQAQANRKASTEALMLERWPGAAAMLEGTPAGMREHAYDALAIATSWTDRATDTPGTRRAA